VARSDPYGYGVWHYLSFPWSGTIYPARQEKSDNSWIKVPGTILYTSKYSTSVYMSNDIKPGALNQRLFDWHIKTVSYTPGGCQRGEHSIAFWIAFLETILTGMALERRGFVVFLHCISCPMARDPRVGRSSKMRAGVAAVQPRQHASPPLPQGAAPRVPRGNRSTKRP